MFEAILVEFSNEESAIWGISRGYLSFFWSSTKELGGERRGGPRHRPLGLFVVQRGAATL